MTKSLFITATGTDIGKTYISGLIVKKMRKLGYNCGYFKPVLSGAYIENGKLTPGDCKYVIESAGLNIEPMDSLVYCFEEAVSPHLAATRANVVIDENKIILKYKELSNRYDYLLIEGAGGITCPLTINDKKNFLLSDLIKSMNVNILIVADGGLGTINSILTTVEYAKNRNIPIKGIVLNNFDKSNFMHKDNIETTEKLTNIKIIATVKKNEKDLQIEENTLINLFE